MQDFDVYCDMDGVLAHFESRFHARGYSGVWRDDNGWLHGIDFEVLRKEDPNFWSSLDPMSDARELWNFLESVTTGELRILTKYPSNWPEAAPQKRIWAGLFTGNKKYTRKDYTICVDRTDKKADYASANSILIDDKLETIEKFRDRGGIAIHHVSAKQTIDELKGIIKSKYI